MNECLIDTQKHLHIQSVNLKEARVYTRDGIDLSTLDRDATSVQNYRSILRVNENTLTAPNNKELWDYRFIYSVGVRLILDDEEEESSEDNYKPIVEVAGIFEAKYISIKKVNRDGLKAFSTDNVGYHVWPYWREYVQSSCARVAFLPGFEVPLYIIPRNESESE